MSHSGGSVASIDPSALVNAIVRRAIVDANIAVPARDEAARALASFLNWAWRQQSLPLDMCQLLREPVVDYYLLNRRSSLSRGRLEWHRDLLKLCAATNVAEGAASELVLSESRNAAPYSVKDRVILHHWARSQSTDGRRDDAHALLALGLGGGLTAREIISTRVGDVRSTGASLEVLVRTGRQRVVPVLDEYAEILDARVVSAPPEDFLFLRHRTRYTTNAVTNFVQRSGPGIHPQARRLRATWLVHHMWAGTPVPTLVEAAGLATLSPIDRLRQFAGETRS